MNVCRICSGEGGAVYRVPEVMFGTRESYDYFQCRSCGCLQIGQIPEDLSRHYTGAYYSFAAPKLRKRSIRRALVDRWAYEGRGGPIGRLLYAHHPNADLRRFRDLRVRRDDPVLDVGCGNGQRVLDLVRAGFTRAEGIDAFLPADVVVEGRVIAHKKTLDAVTGAYKLIMLHHVLEHLPDQHGTLNAARDRLSPEGVLLLRIPTVSSAAWEHYREHWIQIDAPRHLYLHSVESLRALADATGFSLQRIEYDSTEFQFWGSEQARRGIPLVRPGAPWDARVLPARERAALGRRVRRLNAEGRGDQLVAVLTLRP
ncbi:class I SAM-dependent methyltransferase [Anaeromyxobacter terrae]|uniref:class I SAM-dependent methyltransferase n=1 Tax=Anaeromyxobacter terrae TaxID=2925406 RepID=UPI001F5608AC|nr:class I SAM-dependent methyltransferase [Anaeromyxobacter sp. SG22]